MSHRDQDPFSEQARWNAYGKAFLQDLREHPDRHLLAESPLRDRAFYAELMDLLAPLPGLRILELGFGRGRLSVFLAKQGADLVGIEISPSLVAAATELARINQVACEFHQANIVRLPVQANDFDVVMGIAILHHLSPSDLQSSIAEISRALKPGGNAVFVEPVENSRVFDFVQNLIPAGKRNHPEYRPSIVRRRAWKRYVEAMEDRNLTSRELIAVGEPHFAAIRLSPYGFLSRLERFIGRKHRPALNRVDRWLFQILPPLQFLCQTVLVVYRKAAG